MTDKIRELFEKIGNPAVAILKTPRAGDEVDNGYGVEFELPPYAVIHEGNFYKNEDGSKEVYDWQYKNNCEIMKFRADRCSPSVDAMIEELGSRDGYEVQWRKDEQAA